jgi:hypothetical protein
LDLPSWDAAIDMTDSGDFALTRILAPSWRDVAHWTGR